MSIIQRLFLFFLLILSLNSSAQIGGNGVYQFLNLPVSARSVALGGRIVPVLDSDINLSYQNPSLIDSSLHNHLSLNTVSYLEQVNYGYVSYARKIKKFGTIAPGLLFIRYGDFIAADVYGNITGGFTAAEYAFNLGYSVNIDSAFAVGGNFKLISSIFDQLTSHGCALDLAGSYNNKKYLFTIVGIVKNIGFQFKSYRTGYNESLPFEIQIAVSKKLKKAPLRFSFVAHNLQKFDLTYTKPIDPNAGVSFFDTRQNSNSEEGLSEKLLRHLVVGTEILLSKNFHLRAAFDYQRRQELAITEKGGLVGFSFGFGLKISKFSISYGRATYHLAGASNAFSLVANLGEFYKKKR